MNKCGIYSLISLIVFTLSSCCTKKYCAGFERSRTFVFKNYTANEVDTVTILLFVKNSNFQQLVDSTVYLNNTITISNNEQELNTIYIHTRNYDYKIKTQSNTAPQFITDIITKQEVCNACWVNGGDFYDVLLNYKLNNVTQTGNQFVLTK